MAGFPRKNWQGHQVDTRDISMSISEAAKQIQRSTKTIRRWVAEGLDLNAPDVEEQLKAWAEKKALAAKGAARIFSAGPGEEIDIANLPDVSDEGASFALKRLQRFERLTAQRLQEALASGDKVAEKAARENYVSISAVLIKYELLVKAHDRQTGSLISRQESLEFVKNCCTWIRLGITRFEGSSHISQMREAPSDRHAKAIANAGILSGIAGAFKTSLGSNSAVPPDYALLAIQNLRLPGDTVTDPQTPGWNILHHSSDVHGASGWVKAEIGPDKETVLPASSEEIARAYENAVKNLPDDEA